MSQLDDNGNTSHTETDFPGQHNDVSALEYVPDMTDEEREFHQQCHNEIMGHGGVDRTCNKLIALGHYWPHMRNHCHIFIQQCACCQKINAVRVPIHVHKYVTSAYKPFHVLNIDYIGPFPDHSHVLVIICAFTRWTELYWCEDDTAASACNCLVQHFGRFSAPRLIRSDRGLHFANDLIKTFLIQTGTPHNLTLAYSKQENAIVERVNKEINRHLTAFLFSTTDLANYKLALPFVHRILNSSIHTSTNETPASLLFGNQINLDQGILLPFPPLPQDNTPASVAICDMIHIQDTLIAQAQTTLRTADEARLATNTVTETVFPDDSFVLARYHTKPPTRLHTLWQSPLRVVSHHNSEYTLLDVVTIKIFPNFFQNFHKFFFSRGFSQ